jgi:hypothetical protein
LAREYGKRRSSRGKSPKMVYSLDGDLLLRSELLRINRDERPLLKASRRLMELMSDDLPGEVKNFSTGSSGKTREGYMIGDAFGRRHLMKPMAKAYPENGHVKVVYPSKLGKGYLSEKTGLYGSRYVRRLV